MKEKTTEIIINSSPENVWEILMNFNGWKEWNPSVREIIGEAKLGNRLKVTMKAGGKSGTVMKPVITKLENQKSIIWATSMGAGLIFKNQKVIQIEKSGDQTRLTHKELFGGLLPTLMWNKFEKLVEPMLNSMNEGLKRKIEQQDK